MVVEQIVFVGSIMFFQRSAPQCRHRCWGSNHWEAQGTGGKDTRKEYTHQVLELLCGLLRHMRVAVAPTTSHEFENGTPDEASAYRVVDADGL